MVHFSVDWQPPPFVQLVFSSILWSQQKSRNHGVGHSKFPTKFHLALNVPAYFALNVPAYVDKFVEDPDPQFVKSVINHEPPDAEHLLVTLKKFQKEKKLKAKLPGDFKVEINLIVKRCNGSDGKAKKLRTTRF